LYLSQVLLSGDFFSPAISSLQRLYLSSDFYLFSNFISPAISFIRKQSAASPNPVPTLWNTADKYLAHPIDSEFKSLII
jgi:hypothetical protein